MKATLTEKEVDQQLVGQAQAHTALNRVKADIELEYKPGSAGRNYVLNLVKVVEAVINNETEFLQKLGKDVKGGRGQYSLDEIEVNINYWQGRKAKMLARMKEDRVIPFQKEA